MDNKYEDMLNKENYDFNDLLSVMDALLAPGGCAWDRAQTHESLKRYMIEEAYETLEAIDAGDKDMLCEELGDVLLQVVFHARIAAGFSMGDVLNRVCKKMITRHPHVFGAVSANTADEALMSWENMKRLEKGLDGHASSLKRVPANLPALMRAYKVQQKARDAGFDWDDAGPVLDKLDEEMSELRRAAGSGDAAAVEGEMGDLLFAAVNASRLMNVHPELALSASTEKFIRRFESMERMIAENGLSMADMELSEMDVYWEKVKAEERK